ncbi:MAG: flagellar basal body-associated FliL family protein [Clostridiaceae bacterium]|nr:flagellar basal body-associated FliL family protein [Clostridiaceae bacterium]
MESKKLSIILIVIIAVLAVSLAILAGYLFVIQGSNGNGDGDLAGDHPANGENAPEIPSEEDLVKVSLYDGARYFNLRNVDSDKKASILQANVTLKCYKALKRDKDIIVADMVTARSEEIQELIVRFFMTLTAEDVKDPAIMDKAKEDLTYQINALLNEGIEKPEDIVYRVVFSEWLFQ